MALLLSKGDFFTLFLSGGTGKTPQDQGGEWGMGVESSWRWKKRVEAFDSWTSPVLGKGRKEGEVKGQGWRGKMGRLEVTGIGVEEGEAGRLNSSLEGGRGKELSIPYLYFPLFSLFPWLFSSLQRERFFLNSDLVSF
jgi:hypothetical protein